MDENKDECQEYTALLKATTYSEIKVMARNQFDARRKTYDVLEGLQIFEILNFDWEIDENSVIVQEVLDREE